ncbi:hypothetical protein DL96DRAFT_1283470 [Flagelloscypha sp. PMI_526]|nr:hypothetical protein DL96DRAFT_1283470 [Flagelloscypha sp. PMI_526]
MMFKTFTVAALVASFFHCICAVPSGMHLEARVANDNLVYINDKEAFCMIMPRDPATTIGNSEHPGGMKTYCSPKGCFDYAHQGQLPGDFWKHVSYTRVTTPGQRTVKLTGCIRPEKLSRLKTNDEGGQYSSWPGQPTGSKCLGYAHYVQLVEPAQNRACLKCCDKEEDCRKDKATQGCLAAIPGNYFDCA